MTDKRICDLHVHSTYSEGVLTPTQLIDRAVNAGISAMILTDHNDVTGTKEFLAAATSARIESISGVEIYVTFMGKNLHLLGYGCNPDDTKLRDTLSALQQDRRQRIRKSLEKLEAQGFAVDASFLDTIHSRYPGFSHIMKYLESNPANLEKIRADFLPEEPNLFSMITRYFGAGTPAHLPESSITLEEGLQVISHAKGMPILAHPGQQLLTGREDAILVEACRVGVKGIEVLSPYHHWHQVEHYQKFALGHNLLMTGGSDFHTDINFTGKEPIRNQWQVQAIPYELYTGLIHALRRK